MPSDVFQPLFKNKEEKNLLYYDGIRWAEGKSGKSIAVSSPIDNSLVGNVQSVTKAEVDDIFTRLLTAQVLWQRVPLYVRVRMLSTVASLIRDAKDELTELLIAEIGKPKIEAIGEVMRTADLIEYYSQEAQALTGEQMNSDHFPGFDKGRIAVIDRVPYGIVLAIAPFNYPLNLAASKIAPALLLGNAVVFKPPTQGSVSGLYLTQLFLKSGIPENILACITGEGHEIGDSLVTDPRVSMIAFTGSTVVGNSIANKAGMKPLLFECGGNNPVIVLDDYDEEITYQEIIRGAFSYAGQRCTGIKYVLATRHVLEKLVPKIVEGMAQLVNMGDPRREETKLVGPVISEKAAVEVIRAIEKAVQEGATLMTGGKRMGTYVEPTILSNVRPEMSVVKEETFGPILSFIAVSDMHEAVSIVNQSEFGLQAALFTQDEGTGMVLARQLNVGTVQINGSPQRGPDHFPFLGIKKSGIGVQGVKYSLQAMSRIHSVVLNKPK